jgi:hypothetical protein
MQEVLSFFLAKNAANKKTVTAFGLSSQLGFLFVGRFFFHKKVEKSEGRELTPC